MDLSISAEQEAQWREKGFCIVDGFDVSAARDQANFETAQPSKEGFGGFGSKAKVGGLNLEVPCGFDHLDVLPFRLLKVAKRLLRSERVMLSQADTWIKYPQKKEKSASQMSNDDQRIHCDFGNNTIVPTAWDAPNCLSAIVYLDGPDECQGGATCAVPRLGPQDEAYKVESMMLQPGYGGRPFFVSKPAAEKWFAENQPDVAKFRQDLYSREVPVTPKIGRVLLYRVDLWHRGTPLTQGRRRVMNVVYHLQDDPGHAGRWNSGFWKNSYWWTNNKYAVPERVFIELLSPERRTGIGFPPVGDPWWTEERLRYIKLRFPNFDPAPYLNTSPQMQCTNGRCQLKPKL